MATKKQTKKSAQTIWDEHGISSEGVGLFFKVRGKKWQQVELLSIRTAEPFVKQLPAGADDIRVYLELEVRDEGITMPWEITAKTLREELVQKVTTMPCTVWVRKTGAGKHVRYEVATVRPVEGQVDRSDDERGVVCYGSSSCVLDHGHDGDHMTQKQWKAAHGTKAQTLGAST